MSGTEKLMCTDNNNAEDVDAEFLRKSHNRRTEFTQIILVPKRMTYKRRKNMLKTCDFYFYVDVGPSHWIENMH